ncbi:hypothetical protein [Actinoplanes nipponensis]|uniref:hypothetical protein n=1 Tax=Actinoplanes nipponensis TaxID=135950 RepID=UPI0034DAD120
MRLPSAEGYVAAVEKENRWLPELAGHLPLPVPAPVAVGRPGRRVPVPVVGPAVAGGRHPRRRRGGRPPPAGA